MDVPLDSTYQIRPIRLDDAEPLQASHARLSPETVYRRYLAHKPELTSADVRYLVDVDGCDHLALVATFEGEIVGVARSIRIESDPGAAEFAIVVADAHQRHGVATALLTRLAEEAASRGVRRLCATILSENIGIRRLMDRIAAGPVREEREGTVSEVEFDLRPAAGQTVTPAPAMIAGCAGS